MTSALRNRLALGTHAVLLPLTGKPGAAPARILGSSHRPLTRGALLWLLRDTDLSTDDLSTTPERLELSQLRTTVSKAQWRALSPGTSKATS